MLSALAKDSSLPIEAALPLGRSFVLGLPDCRGQFRIFLNGSLWRIAAGDYRAGERVQVKAVDQDMLTVQPVLPSTV